MGADASVAITHVCALLRTSVLGQKVAFLKFILHVRIVQVSVVMCDTGRGVVMILLQGQAFGLCVSSGIVYVRMCEWVG